MLEREGAKLKVAAGMWVVAEIRQGERSVIEYLLSPVRKTATEAGGEVITPRPRARAQATGQGPAMSHPHASAPA
jgi:hypothetical protein